MACSSLLGFGMSFQNLGLATLVGCSFWRQHKTKKGPPHVCQGNGFDLYVVVVVVVVGFVCCCCSSWILYVVVVVVALWCSKSPYNERDWQTATTRNGTRKVLCSEMRLHSWDLRHMGSLPTAGNATQNQSPTQSCTHPSLFFFWWGCCFQHEPRKLNVSSRGGLMRMTFTFANGLGF